MLKTESQWLVTKGLSNFNDVQRAAKQDEVGQGYVPWTRKHAIIRSSRKFYELSKHWVEKDKSQVPLLPEWYQMPKTDQSFETCSVQLTPALNWRFNSKNSFLPISFDCTGVFENSVVFCVVSMGKNRVVQGCNRIQWRMFRGGLIRLDEFCGRRRDSIEHGGLVLFMCKENHTTLLCGQGL